MTSPPNGCCLLSIDATAAGVPVAVSMRVATTVVVPRSKAIANRRAVVSPGSTSMSDVVDDHRGDLEVGLAQHPAAAGAATCRSGRQLEVVDRVVEPAQVGALVGQRRLLELDVALLQRRAQDHLPADPEGGGLGPRRQRRYVDREVVGRLGEAGQPPAGRELLAGERAPVEPVHRCAALDELDLALLAGAVPAARRVDGDAVPARGVEDAHAREARGPRGRRARTTAGRDRCRRAGRTSGPSGGAISPSRRRASTSQSGAR